MTLPEPIAKLRDSEAIIFSGYDKDEEHNGLNLVALDQAVGFKNGANWGFEQGVLYAVELLRGKAEEFEACEDGERWIIGNNWRIRADWLESKIKEMK